jgi:hypothetical protein
LPQRLANASRVTSKTRLFQPRRCKTVATPDAGMIDPQTDNTQRFLSIVGQYTTRLCTQ